MAFKLEQKIEVQRMIMENDFFPVFLLTEAIFPVNHLTSILFLHQLCFHLSLLVTIPLEIWDYGKQFTWSWLYSFCSILGSLDICYIFTMSTGRVLCSFGVLSLCIFQVWRSKCGKMQNWEPAIWLGSSTFTARSISGWLNYLNGKLRCKFKILKGFWK